MVAQAAASSASSTVANHLENHRLLTRTSAHTYYGHSRERVSSRETHNYLGAVVTVGISAITIGSSFQMQYL